MYRTAGLNFCCSLSWPLATVVLFMGVPHAFAAEEAHLSPNQVKVDLRYRLEHVDQDNLLENAVASTLRTRVLAEKSAFSNVRLWIEVDHVETLGGMGYNDTVNGMESHSVVADPRGTDINQAAVAYRTEIGELTAGRFRMNHLNQRFLGGVGWRQNEQTFDGLRFSRSTSSDFYVDVARIHRVNRIFGPKGPNAYERGALYAGLVTFPLQKNHHVGAFVYDFDFTDWNIRDSQTLGMNYHGSLNPFSVPIKLSVTFARQTDAHDQPQSFSHHYHRVSAEAELKRKVHLELGQERLAGDGLSAFQTPLATLHAFQGFTDLFLVTPHDGLRDTFSRLRFEAYAVNWGIGYHRFVSDRASRAYGDEWNLTLSYQLPQNVNVLFKYADYRAKTFAVDTRKTWLMLSYAF